MADNAVKIILSAEDKTGAAIASAKAGLAAMQPQIQAASQAMLGFSTAAGAAAAAVAAIVVNSRAIDAFNDLADATGSSVENISALDRVARETGGNFDTVSTSLIKFNAALKNSDGDNSGTAAALKAIGLSAKELKTLDPSEALRRTAVALASFADDGNKARLTQELFGKSLKEVAPFLKDLADKGALVASVTTKQAQEAETFNKQLYQLKSNSIDVARALSVDLITAINETTKAFRLGAIEGKSFLSIGWDRYISQVKDLYGIADGPKAYAQRLQEINDELATGNIHASKRAALLREQAALEKKAAAYPDFSKDNDSSAETARLGRRASVDFSGAPSKEKKDKLIDITKQQDSAVQGLAESLKGLSGNTSEFDKVMERLTTGTWKDFDAATRAATLAIAGEIDETKRAIAQSKAWQEQQVQTAKEIADAYVLESKAREQGRLAVDDYVKSINDQNASYALEIDMLGKSESARKIATENMRIQIELEKQLEDIRSNAGFNEEQREEMRVKARAAAASAQAGVSNRVGAEDARARDPLAGFADSMRKYQEESEKVAGQVEATFTKAFQGMEDALVKFVMTGKGNFNDMATAVVSDITRIIIKQQIANTMASLLGAGSTGGDWVSKGIGALFGGARANGGPVSSGRAYLVGERGPEIIVPSQSGTVIPNGAGGGNTVAVTINQTFGQETSRSTLLQAAADARRQLEYAGRNL